MQEKLKKCNWTYHNQNPTKREVNDCVVRAISLAEGNSWDSTYNKLSEIARMNGTLLDDVSFVEPYLDSKYDKVCHLCKNCKKTVNDICDEYTNGIYLITMKGHITCIIDGVLYDTWDCGNKLIWCVWKIES